MKIFLDDVRDAPEGWTLVRTVAETIARLEAGGITELSLDHDLGDDRAGTGHDVLVWIEESVVLRGYSPPRLMIHSANPVGRQRMQLAIETIARRLEQRPKAPAPSVRQADSEDIELGSIAGALADGRPFLGEVWWWDRFVGVTYLFSRDGIEDADEDAIVALLQESGQLAELDAGTRKLIGGLDARTDANDEPIWCISVHLGLATELGLPLAQIGEGRKLIVPTEPPASSATAAKLETVLGSGAATALADALEQVRGRFGPR